MASHAHHALFTTAHISVPLRKCTPNLWYRYSLSISHGIVEVDTTYSPQRYCDDRVVLVWMDPASGKSVSLPEAVRDACRNGQKTISP